MIINTDAGLKRIKDSKHNKAFLRASLCFFTSDNDLYYEKIDNFNSLYVGASSNTAELLASLRAFKKYHDKLDKITMYTDCPLLPNAQTYYHSFLESRYKNPLDLLKISIGHAGLKNELDIFVEAIKKATIKKVPGHTGVVENEYVDNVCTKILNDKIPFAFDEFLKLSNRSMFLKDEKVVNPKINLMR
jgi:ribonuclease HI